MHRRLIPAAHFGRNGTSARSHRSSERGRGDDRSCRTRGRGAGGRGDDERRIHGANSRDDSIRACRDGPSVEISNADPAVPDVGIDLPELSGSSAAQEASDGTLVYTSDGDDASLAIQAAADGSTRFLSILESRDAPERYEYTFDGVDLQLLDDGSVLTTHRGAIVGVIQAAWALDANGSPVPTHYEVEGSTLTQVVSHRQGEYAYPVTADPTLSFGWRMYWTLSATEQRYLTVAGAAGGGGALCSATGALACGVATAAAAVIIQWINERGSICKAPRSRLQVGIPYGWPQVKSGKVTMACIK